MDDGNFSSMQICGVNQNDSIVNVVYNSVTVDRYDGIDNILYPNYYSKDTIQMTMNEIFEMADIGIIKSVHW